MQSIYTRADMKRFLAGELDPALRRLLERRLAALDTPLIEETEWLLIVAGDTEDDIVKAIGFSPLVESIDGIRFGSDGFYPHWDHLTDDSGWFAMTISFGSSFAYVLIVEDAEGVLLELRAMCAFYANASS